jgi:DNA-directed RNA polymerase subunit RPC12/RpoP
MNDNPPKRHWSQYSLKTLLVLTTVVALIFAYITYEQRLAQKQKMVVEELEKIKGVKFTLFMEGTQRPPWLAVHPGGMIGSIDSSSSGCAESEMVRIECFGCKKNFTISSKMVGTQLECPKCKYQQHIAMDKY